MTTSTDARLRFYIGTYTRPEPHVDGKGAGIYFAELNPVTGDMALLSALTVAVNPSYVTLSQGGRYLYAVNELAGDLAIPHAKMSAYAISSPDGDLTFINDQYTHGTAPCFVATSATGRFVFVANYINGTIASLPVGDDGGLLPAVSVIQQAGTGPHAEQENAHAHCILPDPDNAYVLVADKGADRLFSYRLDETTGQLTLAGEIVTVAGAGPRHLRFHPNGRYVYLINELDCTLTAYGYADGVLTPINTVPSLPADFSGHNSGADLRVHPSGQWVYGSNRGHDSIVICRVDEATGALTVIGHQSTNGSTPRNFAIEPQGRLLLAANQDSDTIYSYWIDDTSGLLTPTGHQLDVPTPVCIEFTA